MSEVWLTHPNLTAAHDMKVLRAAVGTWVGSGWQVRQDQSDPVEELADPSESVDPGSIPDTAETASTSDPAVVAQPAVKPTAPLDPASTKKGD